MRKFLTSSFVLAIVGLFAYFITKVIERRVNKATAALDSFNKLRSGELKADDEAIEAEMTKTIKELEAVTVEGIKARWKEAFGAKN